jgi:hypothetical protein
VGTVLPGFLIFYIFDYDLFINLEFFKLLLLSLSFIMPIFILNCFVILGICESEPVADRGGLLQAELILTGLINAIFIYLALIIASIIKYKNITVFIICYMVLESIFILGIGVPCIVYFIGKKRKARKVK